MAEQNPTHWFSYSIYEGPGQTTIGNGCMVSVVLDGAARHHFSGIRLIIVYRESEFLTNVRVADCLQTRKFGVIQSGSRRPTYRDLLTRQSDAIQDSKSLLQTASSSALPFYTVVFELVDTSNDLSYSVALSLRRNNDPVTAGAPLRIAYDRIHPCTPSKSSMLTFLECSHSFHGIRRPTHQYSCCMRMASGIPAHSLRVLPIVSPPERALCPILPPLVIRTIVALVVGSKPPGWRKTLLSYGLVCKAWVHVLDLFFGGLPAHYDADMADAIKVARSLEKRPERAALMNSFSPWDYQVTETDEEYKAMCEALMTILGQARSIRDVKLALIHESVARELVERLASLREVRTCVVYPTYDENRDARRTLTMRDIQTFIARWMNLRKLELHEWANEDSEAEDEEKALPQLPLECNLADLRLERGFLTGAQLLRFAPSSPVLKRVDLEYIQGVSNADFLAFLMHVAPTIASLTVRECDFARIQKEGEHKASEQGEAEEGDTAAGAEEEHAIDTAMPYLTSLEQLTVDGKCASALAIVRKAPHGPRPRAYSPTRWSRYDNISIGNAYGISLTSVLRAVEVTRWDTVSVMWHGATDYDEVAVGRVAAEALERGVRFSCHNFDVAYAL